MAKDTKQTYATTQFLRATRRARSTRARRPSGNIKNPYRYNNKTRQFSKPNQYTVVTSHGDPVAFRCKPQRPFVVRELPSELSRQHKIVGSLGSGGTGDVFLASTKEGWHAIKVFREGFEVHGPKPKRSPELTIH
jgi:hypothetical protein